MGMILIIMFVVLVLSLFILISRDILIFLLKDLVSPLQRNNREGKVVVAFCLKLLLIISVIVIPYNYLSKSKAPEQKTLSKFDYFRGIRSHFILPHDHSYGDLLIPKGSLIHRRGGRGSSGGENHPLRLNHLHSVRFPYPIEISGVEAMALSGGAVELAKDFWLRPLYDSKNNALFAEVQPEILCKKGEIAYFHRADFVNRTRRMMNYGFIGDENSIHYKPDTWLFVECHREDRIDVPLPFHGQIGDIIEEAKL